MTAVLVLGAGQVGTFAARALVERGAAVTAADREPSAEFFARFGPGAEAELATADVLDRAALRRLLAARRCEAVVLAVGPAGGAAAGRRAWEVEVRGAREVAGAALAAGVRRLVFLSSFAVYGRPGVARIAETEPPRPESPYARAKAVAEAALCASRARGLEVVVLRPCGIYGPHRSGTGSRSARRIDVLLARCLAGGEVRVRAAGEASDEYLYAKDLGRAIATVALGEAPVPEPVLNVGAGRTTSAEELADALRQALPGARLVVERAAGGDGPARPALDVGRLRALGFSPLFSLAQGLADYLRESRLAS